MKLKVKEYTQWRRDITDVYTMNEYKNIIISNMERKWYEFCNQDWLWNDITKFLSKIPEDFNILLSFKRLVNPILWKDVITEKDDDWTFSIFCRERDTKEIVDKLDNYPYKVIIAPDMRKWRDYQLFMIPYEKLL